MLAHILQQLFLRLHSCQHWPGIHAYAFVAQPGRTPDAAI